MQEMARRSMLVRAAKTSAALALSAEFAPLFAAPEKRRFKIGACDWSLGKMADPSCFALAKEIGLDGVQVSLGTARDDMKLRRADVQREFKDTAKVNDVQIAYDVCNSTDRGYDICKEIRWLGKENICEFHMKENGFLLG